MDRLARLIRQQEREQAELETLLVAATQAAMADTLSGLWAHTLGVRTVLVAASERPNYDGLALAAERLWAAGLVRWVKPVVSWAWKGNGASFDRQWQKLSQRMMWTADLVSNAVGAAIQGTIRLTPDQQRSYVAEVLDLDGVVLSLWEQIHEVEQELLDPERSRVDQDADFARRVRLQTNVFLPDAARARSKGFAALAKVDPDNAADWRRLAREASRTPAYIRKAENELARHDEKLFHNPAMDPDQLARLTTKLHKLNGTDKHGHESWRNSVTRDARAVATGLLNASRLQYGIEQATGSGQEWIKRWAATLTDDLTRPTHLEADAQVQEITHPFDVGGAALDHPADFDAPAEEFWNCVVGSTQVAWPGQDVHATTRRRFSGEFFEIVTTRGHRLTVTPNHPILTPLGYFPASALCPGQSVLASELPPLPEIDNGPPCIEKVQAASLETGVPCRVSGAIPQFHGDGTNTEVQVVRTDLSLRDSFDSELLSEGEEGQLVVGTGAESTRPRSGLTGGGPDSGGVQVRQAVASTGGIVGGGNQSAPLGGGHPGETQGVSLTAASDGQSEFAQSSDDYRSTNSDFPAHLEHALSVGMTACEISEINSFTGDHDVYNLETSGGWYIGNGIAQHNCRCSMIVMSRTDYDEISDALTAATIGDPMSQPVPEELGDLAPLMWHGIITLEDTYTGDRRFFRDGAIRTQPLPAPIRFQREDWGGHSGSVVVANAENARRFEKKIRAWGTFADGALTPEVDEVVGLIATRMMRGISIDGDDVLDSQFTMELDDDANVYEMYDSMRIRGATLCAIPAFDGAEVYLGPPPPEWLLEGEPISTEQNEVGRTRPVSEIPDEELEAMLAASQVPENLAEYWTGPEGSARVGGWGSPGSFNRCLSQLAQYVSPGQVAGTCANLYHRATGEWPGRQGGELSVPYLMASVAVDETLTTAELEKLWEFTREDFAPREFSELTPITITDDGYVSGHLAGWHSCHQGFSDVCVTPPRSQQGYALFHTGAVRLSDGSDLPIGKLTVGAGHANPNGLGVRGATAHYDNSATAVAMVRAVEDNYGIQVSGRIIPGTPQSKIAELLRSPISGDWRTYRGNLEMVAALGVNSPGFLVPRAMVASVEGRQTALLWAGYVERDLDAEVVELASRMHAPIVASLAARIQPTQAEIEAKLASRMSALTTED